MQYEGVREHQMKYLGGGDLKNILVIYVSISGFLGEKLPLPTFQVAKQKRLAYKVAFKLEVIKFAKEHGNRVAERHFGPPPTEKMMTVEETGGSAPKIG